MVLSATRRASFVHLQIALAQEYKMAAFEWGYQNPRSVSAN
jgi:hypothetical protein